MSKIIFISIITLAISTISTPSRADIYKFIDENGVIHFTNVSYGKGYAKVIAEKINRGKSQYDRIIASTSSKYNIEPAIIKAVITAESNWNPDAISHKGAIGLMQLMPETAQDMNVNPFDPEENIEGGTKYLRRLLNRFDGNLNLALAAYNAGPSKVERAGGIPAYTETNKFVRAVNEIYKDTSRNKRVKIYKVTYDDGTVLYTNSPYSR
jgi:soluble lytic murein transglycosylase